MRRTFIAALVDEYLAGSGELNPTNTTLLKALMMLLPASLLLAGSVISLLRERRACLFLQLIGAGCFMVVVLTHIFEALNLFRFMGWGLERSVGHYLDLASAALGFTLFPVGYLLKEAEDGSL